MILELSCRHNSMITTKGNYSYSLLYDLISEKRQLIKLTTGILYQGTGIWFSVHSENIGSNLVVLSFSSNDEPVATQIFNLKVVRDFKVYLQSWGPKLLASLGIFLPIIRALLGLA